MRLSGLVQFITDFADQAVVLPVAAVVLVGLLVMGWRRGAAAWGACVGGVLGVMLVLKLVVFACGAAAASAYLVSPSGHTAASAMVYGGLIVLLAPPSRRATLAAMLAGGGIALLFGLTRLALHVHTVADVVLGAAVGVAGVLALRALAGLRPALRAPLRLLLAAACVVTLLLHGTRMEAETRIRWAAVKIWPLSMCRGLAGK